MPGPVAVWARIGHDHASGWALLPTCATGRHYDRGSSTREGQGSIRGPRWGGGRPPPASAGLALERAVAGCGLVDPGRASRWHVEVGLNNRDRRAALVTGDVHMPKA